jgi:hypothetical protein
MEKMDGPGLSLTEAYPLFSFSDARERSKVPLYGTFSERE